MIISFLHLNCATGYITKKDDLPIIQLNFGRTSSASSYSRHTLGKLQCKGVAGFEGIPESCAELWQIGHFLNGFYTVKGEPHGIKSVYCDFSRTGEPEMESPTEDVLSPVVDRVRSLRTFRTPNLFKLIAFLRFLIGFGSGSRSG